MTGKKKPSQTMAELMAKEGKNIKILKKGDIVEATVTQISPKRVYFDLGAKTEGVIFGKELERVRDFIRYFLKVGDKVGAVVGNPEDARGQILLNLNNQARAAAWRFYEEKLKTGEELEVVGKGQNQGGLLVDAPFSLAGFIPESCLRSPWKKKVDELVGKRIKVKVIEVDKEKNRLVFSERAVSEKEQIVKEKKLLRKIKKGDILKVKIKKVAPYGLFVNVEEEGVALEGLIHISEISWDKVDNLTDLYRAGDEIKAMVLSKQGDRLQLSLKQLKPDPWQKVAAKYKKGKQVKGTVSRITSYGWLVNLEKGVEGLVHISKIPAGKEVKVGEKIDCFVETVDVKNRRISLTLVLKEKPVGYK